MALRLFAGNRLSADRFNSVTPYFSQKAADTSIASSVAVTADADLVLTLPANRTYVVRLHIGARGAVAGDIKADWTSTGTLTCNARFCNGPATTMTGAGGSDVNETNMKIPMRGFGDDVSYGIETSADSAHIWEVLVVATGASGGNLQFRWAQNTSNATATVVVAGSFVVAMPVD